MLSSAFFQFAGVRESVSIIIFNVIFSKHNTAPVQYLYDNCPLICFPDTILAEIIWTVGIIPRFYRLLFVESSYSPKTGLTLGFGIRNLS